MFLSAICYALGITPVCVDTPTVLNVQFKICPKNPSLLHPDFLVETQRWQTVEPLVFLVMLVHEGLPR